MTTNVDKLNEVLARETDFRHVDRVDCHSDSLEHGYCTIRRSVRGRFLQGKRRKILRTLSDLRSTRQQRRFSSVRFGKLRRAYIFGLIPLSLRCGSGGGCLAKGR